jgi:acyl-CoA reductase-like NAD-dependent aldehyde dehydrogenase
VDKISFTGSTATGKAILRQSVGDPKRVSLELGGKSASIVFADADLARAIPPLPWAFSATAGRCARQARACSCTRRSSTASSRLVAFTQKLRVGPGHEEGVALGPLISAPQRDKVMAYIEAGRREGATLLTGGDAPSGKGYSSTPPSLSIPTRA